MSKDRLKSIARAVMAIIMIFAIISVIAILGQPDQSREKLKEEVKLLELICREIYFCYGKIISESSKRPSMDGIIKCLSRTVKQADGNRAIISGNEFIFFSGTEDVIAETFSPDGIKIQLMKDGKVNHVKKRQ